MRKHIQTILFVTCMSLMLLNSRALYSQDTTSSGPTMVWGSFGIGMGSVLTESLDLNFQKGHFLFSVRGARQASLELFLLGTGDTMESEELGFLVGIADGSRHHLFSISAGLARVEMVQREAVLFFSISETKKSTIIGVPIETQVVWKATESLGLGINAYANLNSERSYAGIGIKLVVGKLR